MFELAKFFVDTVLFMAAVPIILHKIPSFLFLHPLTNDKSSVSYCVLFFKTVKDQVNEIIITLYTFVAFELKCFSYIERANINCLCTIAINLHHKLFNYQQFHFNYNLLSKELYTLASFQNYKHTHVYN